MDNRKNFWFEAEVAILFADKTWASEFVQVGFLQEDIDMGDEWIWATYLAERKVREIFHERQDIAHLTCVLLNEIYGENPFA